jgi:endonuclease YncB( thermonuclease family)
MLLALTPLFLGSAAIAACPAPGSSSAPRHHCVHDGDTLWWHGEKIRLAEIDAPELTASCPRERALALSARDRLIVLLNERRVTIRRTGTDRFGRTLAVISPIGDQLVREGLAGRWPGRIDWCGNG